MPKLLSLDRVSSIGKITARLETSSPGRLGSTAFQVALSLWLLILLWRGLYHSRPIVAGVTEGQAVTYAVIAALLTYLKVGDRGWSRDGMPHHVRLGTIMYWFLWPIRPATYHAVRAVGDVGYAFAWAIPAYLICLLTGSIAGPTSMGAGALAFLSVLLGQTIAYLIGLLLDLVCLWTLVNEQIIRMTALIQALMSGGFAPLWFFPEWFQTLSRAFPFASIVNAPLSLYFGRTSEMGAVFVLAAQCGWCLALGSVAALVWRRSRRRIEVLGG